MPLAVTHVVPAVILFNFFKKKLNLEKYEFPHAAFIAAVGALLPDIDIFLGRFLHLFGFNLAHGSYTHTPFFALIFLLPAVICFFLKKYRLALLLSLLGFGIIIHIFLDYLIGGGAEAGVMWFYPFSYHSYKIHLLSSLPYEFWPQELDALVLLGWIYFKPNSFK
jgi:membrane-bound metal-dependent hydrolase YbcI (DUF457 family)